jgi:acyl-CoA thioesterase
MGDWSGAAAGWRDHGVLMMTMAKAGRTKPVSQRELAKRLRTSNVVKQFGFELKLASPGRVVMQMRVRARHKQAHNVVHGGVLAALADTAGGLATYLVAPSGGRVATVEMKINYLEPVRKGTVTADARVLRVGRNLAVLDCDLHEGKNLVGKALMTFSMVAPTE